MSTANYETSLPTEHTKQKISFELSNYFVTTTTTLQNEDIASALYGITSPPAIQPVVLQLAPQSFRVSFNFVSSQAQSTHLCSSTIEQTPFLSFKLKFDKLAYPLQTIKKSSSIDSNSSIVPICQLSSQVAFSQTSSITPIKKSMNTMPSSISHYFSYDSQTDCLSISVRAECSEFNSRCECTFTFGDSTGTEIPSTPPAGLMLSEDMSISTESMFNKQQLQQQQQLVHLSSQQSGIYPSVKSDKKNVVKNFMKAFDNYFLNMRCDELIMKQFNISTAALQRLRFVHQRLLKKFNFNNRMIIEMIKSPNKMIFEHFLRTQAASWIQNSNIIDKHSHMCVLKDYLRALADPASIPKISNLKVRNRASSSSSC